MEKIEIARVWGKGIPGPLPKFSPQMFQWILSNWHREGYEVDRIICGRVFVRKIEEVRHGNYRTAA